SISKVIAYAPTLSTKSSSGVSNCFVTVRNVTLYNSYSGIDAMGGAQHLSGIYGTVLNSGIKIGSNAEVSEFMNIDFSADYWNSYDGTSSDAIKGYTKSNATAISIGYVDDILVYNVKARAEEFAKGVYFYLEHEARANGCSGIAYGFTYKIDGEISYSGDYDNFNEGWPQMNHLDRIANTERYDYSEPTQRYSGKSALFNVRSSEFGAKGDGKADDTQAFISALKAAGDNGGGIVFVPSGNYVVTQSLTVPSNVEVLGEWYGYRTGSPSRIDMKFEGAGDDALFILSRDSGVQGLTFYIPAHKAQTYVPPTGADYGYGNGESYNVTTDVFPTEHINAKEYPWFIRANGNKCWAENICITNGWNGLDFASAKCDNLAIRGVWGTCMNECINVGGGSEDGKISCVFFTFGTWWESVGRAYDLSLWSYTNVKGVTFGDCKNIQVLSCSTFGLSKGISFVAEGGNKPENISILRSLIDSPYGWVCLDIQAGDKLSYLGVSTGTHPTEDNGRISTAITVGENFDGTARLYGQNIWAGCENVIRGDVVLYSASDTQTEVIDHNFKNPDYSVQVDEQKSGGCGKSQAGLTALVSMGLGILLLNFIKKI
ncbi:MAG: glycosyl hydrolase family 28-related protein, partial [Christensenellales bacterium]